jgi:hypothetical protein
MGLARAIPDYLRAWEKPQEQPCPHDAEKPCVPCLHRRLHNRRWREANLDRYRELVREGARRMRAKNPRRCRSYARRFYSTEEQKAKRAQQNRSWHERNRGRHRELGRRWREANREKSRNSIRASLAKRRSEHPELVRALDREESARRRARVLGAFIAPVDPIAVYDRDGGLCSICGLSVPRKTENHLLRASLDHRIPLARGGTHEPANVALAHALCNSTKHARTSVPLGVVERLRTRIAGEA